MYNKLKQAHQLYCRW